MGKKKSKKTPTSTKAFRAAQKAAEKRDFTVCGTLDSDGKPIYFTMPKGSTLEEVADAAFLARNGRPPTDTEKEFMKRVVRQVKRG
jgi:hypothetical protein